MLRRRRTPWRTRDRGARHEEQKAKRARIAACQGAQPTSARRARRGAADPSETRVKKASSALPASAGSSLLHSSGAAWTAWAACTRATVQPRAAQSPAHPPLRYPCRGNRPPRRPPCLRALPAPCQRLHLRCRAPGGACRAGADPGAPAGGAPGQGHGAVAAPVPAAQPHRGGRDLRAGSAAAVAGRALGRGRPAGAAPRAAAVPTQPGRSGPAGGARTCPAGALVAGARTAAAGGAGRHLAQEPQDAVVQPGAAGACAPVAARAAAVALRHPQAPRAAPALDPGGGAPGPGAARAGQRHPACAAGRAADFCAPAPAAPAAPGGRRGREPLRYAGRSVPARHARISEESPPWPSVTPSPT